MSLILVGLPFFKSISQGWLIYYDKSSDPKFTEEQIRMSNHAATMLDNCYPVNDFLNPITHSKVCRSLTSGDYSAASRNLEMKNSDLDLTKAGCIEALKIGVWLLGTCFLKNIRLATVNLLACKYFFPNV